ncbi:MAG: rod shape-determining protein MreC [Endomicrobium sp.]|jgi:rod shape-determining protein MreC|nr:rod shape-determining protein MreC [Endomicrobium sp.]
MSFKDDLAIIRTIKFLRKENTEYKTRNKQLIDQLRNYIVIYEEYKKLLQLFQIKPIKNTTSVFARMFIRDCNEWYKYIIIDKGTSHGIHNGFPVLIFNKQQNELCALGRIQETYKTVSKVILITKSLTLFPVMIKNKNIHCLAEGNDSNILNITYIPKDANVKHGDKIIISSLSSIFQCGILVGIITKVLKAKSGDHFKTAKAKVYFDNNIIHQAIVLIPFKS